MEPHPPIGPRPFYALLSYQCAESRDTLPRTPVNGEEGCAPPELPALKRALRRAQERRRRGAHVTAHSSRRHGGGRRRRGGGGRLARAAGGRGPQARVVGKCGRRLRAAAALALGAVRRRRRVRPHSSTPNAIMLFIWGVLATLGPPARPPVLCSHDARCRVRQRAAVAPALCGPNQCMHRSEHTSLLAMPCCCPYGNMHHPTHVIR